MPKPRYKTNNWKQYNQALINSGSLTFWIDEDAISEWKQGKQNKRGRPRADFVTEFGAKEKLWVIVTLIVTLAIFVLHGLLCVSTWMVIEPPIEPPNVFVNRTL